MKSLPRRGYLRRLPRGPKAADHAPEMRARASYVSRLTTNLGARALRAGPRPDRTRCVQLSRVCPLCRFLKAAESRDKVFTLPELTILAFHKLLRFLDGLFLVRTFDALHC